MSIFVTGATGVLGRPVIRELGEWGYRVHALCRSPSDRSTIIRQGAIPEEIDPGDSAALAAVLERCDMILLLATMIPPSAALELPGIWKEIDRVRRDGMAAIVQAARRAGSIRTLLYPSISYFYGDGAHWLDAGMTLTAPASFQKSTRDAKARIKAFTDEEAGRRGVVLRFGALYGPVSPYDLQRLGMTRGGAFVPIAAPSSARSTIRIEDAVHAVVRAVEHAPTGLAGPVGIRSALEKTTCCHATSGLVAPPY